MALNPQDIALIEARAELIADRVADRVVTKVVAAVLKTHVATCPYGRWLNNTKRVLIGMAIGVTLVSAGSSAATALIIKLL